MDRLKIVVPGDAPPQIQGMKVQLTILSLFWKTTRKTWLCDDIITHQTSYDKLINAQTKSYKKNRC